MARPRSNQAETSSSEPPPTRSCHAVKRRMSFPRPMRLTSTLSVAVPPAASRGRALPRRLDRPGLANAGEAVSITPSSPRESAAAFGSVIRSPRTAAASTMMTSGVVLPSTAARPAPVRPGLRNMAPYARTVPVAAMTASQGHCRRGGRNGPPESRMTGRSAAPPPRARSAANRSGGAKARPALIAR